MAELAPTGDARTFRLGFAGDTFNTAWYLAQISTQAGVAYFTAVGDDDQSIYAWRGADPQNLARLKDDLPDLKIIKTGAQGEQEITLDDLKSK